MLTNVNYSEFNATNHGCHVTMLSRNQLHFSRLQATGLQPNCTERSYCLRKTTMAAHQEVSVNSASIGYISAGEDFFFN